MDSEQGCRKLASCVMSTGLVCVFSYLNESKVITRETNADSTRCDKYVLRTNRLLTNNVLTIRPDDRPSLFPTLPTLISARDSLSTDKRRGKTRNDVDRCNHGGCSVQRDRRMVPRCTTGAENWRRDMKVSRSYSAATCTLIPRINR